MAYETGRIVLSKSGRDKDLFFVVLSADSNYVTICDGRKRRLESPKTKNVKHVTKTACIIAEEQLKTNKSIRHALRDFVRGDQRFIKGDD
ncbi:MAG: KOW domain-containing RNA-binding protein [bacterium]|nr:KOW domain-containing RNA-binding protein [bacterium]